MTRTAPLAAVASESLRGLPGYVLRSLAELWLEPDRLARVVDAALADVHAEWAEARAQGRRVRARWIAARGNAVLACVLTASALSALRADLPRLTTIALGALLFPLLLFALLADAIHQDVHVRIGDRYRAPHVIPGLAPVIRPPVKPRPIKAIREPARNRGVQGHGLAPWRERPVFAGFGPGSSGPLAIEIPKTPGLGPVGTGRASDPIPLVRIPPEYPQTLVKRAVEGFVVVRLWIGAQGEVSRAEIAQADPPRVFERAALEGVRRWRYRPAQRDGQAVAYGPLEVLLEFKLADAPR